MAFFLYSVSGTVCRGMPDVQFIVYYTAIDFRQSRRDYFYVEWLSIYETAFSLAVVSDKFVSFYTPISTASVQYLYIYFYTHIISLCIYWKTINFYFYMPLFCQRTSQRIIEWDIYRLTIRRQCNNLLW